MRISGRISKEPLLGQIMVCEQFSNENEEILGAITRKFSGNWKKLPIAITQHLDLFEVGDYVRFFENSIELEVEERHVVSAFVLQNGKILLLKRSERVGSFRGFWATISGYIEGNESALSRARKEMLEEAGLRRPRLLRQGREVLVRAGKTIFVVHPFLFTTHEPVSIDWEHTEYLWVSPKELRNFNTVPKLADALSSVMTKPKRIYTDNIFRS